MQFISVGSEISSSNQTISILWCYGVIRAKTLMDENYAWDMYHVLSSQFQFG